MTRVIVDAATVAKLQGLSKFLEFCDEQGNVLGRFEPDEKSPAFLNWLRAVQPGIPEEELRRREERDSGASTEEVLRRLVPQP